MFRFHLTIFNLTDYKSIYYNKPLKSKPDFWQNIPAKSHKSNKLLST